MVNLFWASGGVSGISGRVERDREGMKRDRGGTGEEEEWGRRGGGVRRRRCARGSDKEVVRSQTGRGPGTVTTTEDEWGNRSVCGVKRLVSRL